MTDEKGRLVVAADSHQISSFQLCRRKYKYEAIDNLERKKDTPALSRGTLWHKLMEDWVKGVPDTENVKKIEEADLGNEDPAVEKADKDLIYWRYFAYIALYANDKHKREYLGTEVGFDKIIYQDDNVLFIYRGAVDLIFRENGTLFWTDYKTQNPKYAFSLYHYTNQFFGYSWALGTNVGMIDYTTWSVKVNEKTFRREIVNHPKPLVDQWRRDTIETFRQILNESHGGKWPRSRSGCDAKYRCPFTRLCETSNDIAHNIVVNTHYQEREPWKPWELEKERELEDDNRKAD